VASGANSRLSPGDVKKASAMIGNAKVLLIQLETPLNTVTAAARTASKNGAVVILNPAPAPARALPAELLRCVSILTPNETEAERLTGIVIDGIAAAERAAAKLRRRGVQSVVMTLGAQGAFVASDEMTGLVPGFPVKAVDTTAAGDVFNGALAVALGEGQALDCAVRFANAAAAIAVTRRGAQPSAPHRREIEKFLASRGRKTRRARTT
jgi:ribokinase